MAAIDFRTVDHDTLLTLTLPLAKNPVQKSLPSKLGLRSHEKLHRHFGNNWDVCSTLSGIPRVGT